MSSEQRGPVDLEARARWHLELWERNPEPPPMSEAERRAFEDDEYDGEYLGHVTCWNCGGEGSTIECCDDLCHGQGWCMHGDNRACRECGGEGWL